MVAAPRLGVDVGCRIEACVVGWFAVVVEID